MNVLVTGATGFVGRALVQRLLGRGRGVVAEVRDEAAARDQLGPDVELLAADAPPARRIAVLSRCDAVVNLAGENVVQGRWTAERKRALRDSRVERTRDLVAAMAHAPKTPPVLISASAVGYYGNQGDTVLTEQSPGGDGFLAELCHDWEAAALDAERSGARVTLLRIGLVLGLDGGALAAMLPAYRMGVGGPLGDGSQYMPWVHIDDLVAMIERALVDDAMQGPLNAVAPHPVDGAEFAHTLGEKLGRPAVLRAPAFALRAAMGERAEVLLQSQCAVPERLERLGFAFRHRFVTEALEDLLQTLDTVAVGRARSDLSPDTRPSPHYVLETRSSVHAPLQEVFEFFCDAKNLGLITPRWMRFRITHAPAGAIGNGTELRYRIQLGPFPLRWTTHIRRWSPPNGFVDTQSRGPYRLWWHEHDFVQDGERTVMVDRVYYRLPAGPLGRIAHWAWVGHTLRMIFAYRRRSIARLFAQGECREEDKAGPHCRAA